MTAGAVPASIDPRTVSATRDPLHHAALLVSSIGRSFAERASGFRHAALTWDEERGALRGATFVSSSGTPLHAELRFEPASLSVLPRGTIQLDGHTFDEVIASVRAWLNGAGIDASHLAMRLPKDLPPGPITTPGPMTIDPAAAAALGSWFGFANRHLAEVAGRAGVEVPVPCWPDHFDLAAVVLVPPPAPADAQVTLGFSPGDGSIVEPYFYLTPWPLAPSRVAEVPAPARGRWQVEGWLGMALTASAALAADDPDAAVAAFLERGLELGRDLLRAT